MASFDAVSELSASRSRFRVEALHFAKCISAKKPRATYSSSAPSSSLVAPDVFIPSLMLSANFSMARWNCSPEADA